MTKFEKISLLSFMFWLAYFVADLVRNKWNATGVGLDLFMVIVLGICFIVSGNKK
jgi:hypothetical protein